MASENDINRVCVVTGASRGAGKGIALALSKPGTVVYVTGRSQKSGDAVLPGTIHETAALINERGAMGIAVAVDHNDDAAVKALFEQVEQDHGRLDILVNNACAIPDGLIEAKPFWLKGLHQLDIMQVGMRSHYVASYYAAELLNRTAQLGRTALVVHTSSAGGRCYMHGPAYGGGKAAVDKFANDMAVDFRAFNVACVSIWMGLLATERTLALMDAKPEQYGSMKALCESPEFTGRVINALFEDPELMAKSGRILVAADEAISYCITDIGGFQPPSPVDMLGAPAQANPAVVE